MVLLSMESNCGQAGNGSPFGSGTALEAHGGSRIVGSYEWRERIPSLTRQTDCFNDASARFVCMGTAAEEDHAFDGSIRKYCCIVAQHHLELVDHAGKGPWIGLKQIAHVACVVLGAH